MKNVFVLPFCLIKIWCDSILDGILESNIGENSIVKFANFLLREESCLEPIIISYVSFLESRKFF